MKLTRHIIFNSVLTCILLAVASSLQAQQVTGTPGSPSTTTSIDGKWNPQPVTKVQNLPGISTQYTIVNRGFSYDLSPIVEKPEV